ncbi:MAG: hypothetical protein EOP48_07325 [Sphingobacteriales bacterium]|nr:MAG: hypothetical protein EOP48_07325 [Sphingobacteriales bacterium]
MASIGWIDFSPSHRDKVGAALDLLTPEGMVDELGLGSLRDSMANQLFPGISTIQTRAKYFFIVPYILYEYQALMNNRQARGRSASKYLEQREYEVMWDLADKYRYIKRSGVIGATKFRKQKLVRRPSAIYWNGINLYKLLDSGGLSAEVFLRKASKGEFESLLSQITNTEDPTDDADAEHENVFRLKIFPPKNWPADVSLDLTQEEAAFLSDNIISKAKGKMIATLLTDQKVWDVCDASENFMGFAKAAYSFLTPQNQEEVVLAHDFSELMCGAHITYNCLLQKRAFNNSILEDDWQAWLQELPHNMIAYDQFDLEKLLSYSPRTRKSTIAFVRQWIDLVYNGGADLAARNTLVEEQEFNVKRTKARIKYQKFDDVKQNVWVGFRHLEYRFRNVQTIIGDIEEAL